MNELTDIVNEKQEEKVKGREISLNRLKKNMNYHFRVEKTPTFVINYNPPRTKEEIEEEITFHKKLNPCNKQKFYVALIKRNK
ncbi:MAG TPA: hypothetical protein VMZ91_11080 [Candidatus Paceibacterota bacterium]|nr:hypothetical protein [Candidatus Paceibacterota bacterium]